MPPPAAPSPPYLPALTGVRAVAAYLVFCHHFNPFPATGSLRLLHNMVLEFHIGVPIFFVLSGFLITLRYAQQVAWTRGWWGQYLRNRLARIYPMYFLVTGLTFAGIYALSGEFNICIWLANVLLLRGFFEQIIYSGVAQGWTLTVEECFYLLAPLFFGLLARHPRRLWLLPFGLLTVGGALVLLFAPLGFHGLFASFRFMLLFTFFGRCFEFFAGIQLAYWYQQDRLRRYAFPGLLTGTGLLLMALAVAGMVWTRGGYTYGQEHPFGVALNNVMLPGGIMLLFAGLLTEKTWLVRLLSTPLLQVLGKSSYIFYLIHLGLVQQFLHRHIVLDNDSLGFLVVFGLLNLLAIGLFYFVEQPFNRLIRQQPTFMS